MNENFFGTRVESPSGKVVIKRSSEKNSEAEKKVPEKELTSEEIFKRLQEEAAGFKNQKTGPIEEGKITKENIFKI
jgi:hypothetical protein